jgi:hypothetical protein
VTVSISPQIRIVALLGLLAAVCLAAGLHFMSRSTTEPAAVAPTAKRVHPQRTHVTAPAHEVAPAKAKPAVTPARHTPSRTTAAAKPAPKPKPEPAVGANGLPSPLNDLLKKHPVVVVAFFAPDSPVDGTALAEARAGAANAGVGFLAVNVVDEKVAAPLAGSLSDGELLPDPGILIYRASGKLVSRFDGFLDKTAVAQAAVDARP